MMELGKLIGILKYNEPIQVKSNMYSSDILYEGTAIMCYDYLKEYNVDMVESLGENKGLVIIIFYDEENQ